MPHIVYLDTLANQQGSDPKTVESFDSHLEETMDRSLSTIDEERAREEGVEATDQHYEIYSGGRSPVIIYPSGVEVSPADDMFTDESPSGKKRKCRKLSAIFLVGLLVVVGISVVIAGTTTRGAKSESSISKIVQQDNTVSSGNLDEDMEQDSSPENGSDTAADDFEDNTGEMESGDASSKTPSTPHTVPSPSPTKSPSECLGEEIVTDKSCFSLQEAISVSFQQCDPRGDDWIGIYPVGSDPLFLGENYFEWSWSCGDKTCQGASMENTIEINSIQHGWYQAFLVMDSPYGAPYHSVASSAPFRITSSQCPDS
jgi:hypothetical protein